MIALRLHGHLAPIGGHGVGVIARGAAIRVLTRRGNIPWVTRTFLETLANVFSDHTDFWSDDEHRFAVPYQIKQKLKKFPVNDPEIQRLIQLGGRAFERLRYQLIRYINSGKRTHHLTPRGLDAPNSGVDDDDDASEFE